MVCYITEIHISYQPYVYAITFVLVFLKFMMTSYLAPQITPCFSSCRYRVKIDISEHCGQPETSRGWFSPAGAQTFGGTAKLRLFSSGNSDSKEGGTLMENRKVREYSAVCVQIFFLS